MAILSRRDGAPDRPAAHRSGKLRYHAAMKTLLIVGLGDIARRALPRLRGQFEIVALVRDQNAADARGCEGIRIEQGDLDQPETLAACAGRVTHLLHTVPPPVRGIEDPRTTHLLAALAEHPSALERIVYISTSGVYGNCDGAFVDESRPTNPQSDRARRRVDAEQRLFAFGHAHGVRIVVLRAPGIYAADRLPLKRLHAHTPVLRDEDDVYTNHIHADDLAAMCETALVHPRAEGIYHAVDNSEISMSAWFDLLADRSGLARPPRIARAEAEGVIAAPLLSFMSESRRLRNDKIKRELSFALRYPTVYDGVPAAVDPGAPRIHASDKPRS